eukprot:CAMPEP_0172491788 /NCGR_PEP_ID=MMETSP1066-20121228/22655_1 /TAXON_ID=671091 /ORGANISM="Coscinodiscus wailesii, Strain CCMP2513" /LENGTH=437 /DNA_ID=CAMNT_0013261003 /DNA_START=104 /DNA_END=1413 /DNA_ORIENTATION=-
MCRRQSPANDDNDNNDDDDDNNNNNNHKTPSPPRRHPRPRLIYAVIFTWLASCGGRFTAPFLENQARFTDAQTGMALAAQMACCSLVAPLGGALADARERSDGERHGRVGVMILGVVLGTVSFLGHGVVRYYYLGDGSKSSSLSGSGGGSSWVMIVWHFGLRLFYAVALGLIMPVLDGLTLAYLKKVEAWGGGENADYGSERLHGAIWWAVANIIIGPLIDLWGFKVLYASAILSMMVCIIMTVYYVNAINEFEATNVMLRNESPSQTDDMSSQHHSVLNSNKESISLVSLSQMMCASFYGASFLLSCFTLSMGTSVVENLIFLFFDYLGGTNTLCGLTVTVTVMFEIPIFYVAPWLMDKVGPGSMQHAACVAYIIRVLGYSAIPRDQIFWVLFMEPLHGVTYACSKLSGVEFVNRLMPEGYEASGQGLLTVFQGLG